MMANNFAFLEKERKNLLGFFYIFYVVVKKMLLLSADIYGLWIILEKKVS